MNALAQLVRNEDGATMVEYAVMLGFIAAACFLLVAALGSQAASNFYSFDAAAGSP
jgi:Flp pilus assembly pilin Flp